MEEKRFEGKVIISSGAASGMGYLTCENFVKEGGSALMADINPEALEKAVEKINAIRPGSAVGQVCDVRDYAQVCAARDKAVEVFGRIDTATNFAGGDEMRVCGAHGEFPDVPIEVFDWGIDVNLRAQLYMAHAVLKTMRDQKSGVIVNIGSISGFEGSAYGMAYSASKSGAAFGLTKSIAKYGAKYGIRCVCVSPGPVLTRPDMANMKTLLGRAAEPQEIVDAVLWLASDKAAFITGTNLLIDGGRDIMSKKG